MLRLRVCATPTVMGLCAALMLSAPCSTTSAEDGPPRFEFSRMVAHWSDYGDPGYLPFIDAAQPEVAQIGFYGGHFWSLAHTPFYKGYPAHFPVQGIEECGEWFANMNRELHKRDVKVIGHFNTKFLVGDPDGPEGPRGFFKFYRDLWDEKVLGPKPTADPLTLLERNRDGSLLTNDTYSIGKMKEYWGCLSNPLWRQVMKAWVKFAVDQGVDGLIANYFYRHDCHCEHCVAGFKGYLKERHTAEQLKEKFAIADLAKHQFDEIVCWHKPEESTPLRREMLAWSQIANKQAFDDVFIKYGRSLKPDLRVAQWNHLSFFSQISGDERCLLPAEMWGRGEDYLWYSSGAAAHFSDIPEGLLGEITLQARYVRGAFDDKPFTFGKYESTRTRMAIAELAANGGAPMGFYTRFKDPLAAAEIARYYQFMKRYNALYDGNRPHAEAALLYPRSHVHQGNLEPLARFKELGVELLNRHVLFDVIPDDIDAAERLQGYDLVINPAESAVDVDNLPKSLSKFAGPATVRVSVNRPKNSDELDLHVVNYNRIEPEKKRSAGGGIKDEQPIAVPKFGVDLRLPQGFEPGKVSFISPESPEPVAVKFENKAGRLTCELPEFLVYGVLRVEPAGK